MQICSAETIGGGEWHVIDLTRALIERGHDLHLVLRPESPLRAALAGWPVTFHELPLRNSIDPVSIVRLSRLIRHESIEVLQAHVGRDYIVGGLVARLNPQVRFFITRHHFRPFRAGLLYNWALAKVVAMIAVSATVRDRIVADFPRLADRVRVVPNWHHRPSAPDLTGSSGCSRTELEARDMARTRLGLTRSVAVGIIGQISPLKGQDIFVEAAIALLAEPVDAELEFLVIGAPGPSDHQFTHGLVQRVSAAGYSGRIRFTGYIQNLEQILPALDIVAILSENEAFSLVLIEAMAAGIPVVATPVGGVAEILREEQTGVFTERTPSSLAAILTRLAQDPALRQRLGSNARAEVRARFDRQRVTGIIEALLTGTSSSDVPS
jgi:L-malate glycosyltransferase